MRSALLINQMAATRQPLRWRRCCLLPGSHCRPASAMAQPTRGEMTTESTAALGGCETSHAAATTSGSLRGVTLSSVGVAGAAPRAALFALVELHGGRAQTRLDQGCTHLLVCGALALAGEAQLAADAKCSFARRHNIPAVAPSFVEEAVRLGGWQHVHTTQHTVGPASPVAPLAGTGVSSGAATGNIDAAPAEGQELALPGMEQLVVFVGSSFEPSVRQRLATDIRQSGAAVQMKYGGRHGCTHALCAHRGDPAYPDARVDGGCAVVSSVWWEDCQRMRRAAPATQCIYYHPPGSHPIEGMDTVRLTVTGLKDDARREVRSGTAHERMSTDALARSALSDQRACVRVRVRVRVRVPHHR
jgi:hypothetical protein